MLVNARGYLFNSTIAGIDDADALLIIGSNPRIEAAVLNSRIRRNWLVSRMPIGVVGPKVDLTYDADFFGEDPSNLDAIADGSHKFAVQAKKGKTADDYYWNGSNETRRRGCYAWQSSSNCGSLWCCRKWLERL